MRRVALVLLLGLALPAVAQQAADTVAPEAAGAGMVQVPPALRASAEAKAAGRPAVAEDWMIAAAHPLAVEAGAGVLARGGTAADAMVAAQAVLGLVEPQSSGLGGGAFLVWHDGETGEITTLDGRETAPLAATPRLFQDAQGAPLDFFEAVVGGRSVGVPGTPALMAEAQARWGRVPWPGLFDPAIRLAEEGFAVSPRLAGLVARDADRLARYAATRAYFLPGGAPLEAGDTLRNPAYAATLRILAEEGPAPFYTGAIAADIVATVQGAEGNPGELRPVDLAIYELRERDAVCVPYRGYEVCGMGPPSSGGVTVGQILGLLRPFDLADLGPDSAEAWRLIGDASRLAFADRGRYLADSDFVPVPVQGLLDPTISPSGRGSCAARTRFARWRPGPRIRPCARLGQGGDARAACDLASLHRRFPWQRAVDDQHDRERLRVAAHGARLSSQQRADGFFLCVSRGRARRCQCGRAGQASALVDGAHHPAPRRAAGAGAREPGGQPHHRLRGKDDHRLGGLGHGRADGGRPAASGQSVRPLRHRAVGGRLAPALVGMGYDVALGSMSSGLHAIEIGARLEGGADPRREGLAYGE